MRQTQVSPRTFPAHLLVLLVGGHGALPPSSPLGRSLETRAEIKAELQDQKRERSQQHQLKVSHHILRAQAVKSSQGSSKGQKASPLSTAVAR